MKKLKLIISLLLTFNLLNIPTYAISNNGYYVQNSYDQTNTQTNTQTNNSNNNIATSVTNSNSNNTTNNITNISTTNTNSNNMINSNNTINNYYQPTINTAVTNNGYISNGMSNDTENNLDSALDNNLKIGGISILDSFTTIVNNYQQYYKPNNNPQLKFFNGGIGNYGDFLLTLELSNRGNLTRITYLQWNLINPVLTMNLGALKPGDNANLINIQYGKPDQVLLNGEVRQVIYNNLSYKTYPVKLIIYVNNHTNQIYGYEVSLRS